MADELLSSLRRRTDADLEPLADLWVASWREAMPDIDFSARREWFCGHLPALEAAGAMTICGRDDGGRLLGFVTFDPATGYLDQIAVASEAKGSGAAAALLREARRISSKPLFLDVNQDNPRALRFYAREGFETVATGVNPHSGLKIWRLRAAPPG
ncbi:GNAT family N-acetyltransferase [Methylocella tundrae]|uniref:GNAT family N-acetyltransferase n=1 Tax=Methylocella tundrae TaxID=227605 RepID=A0A8B6MAB6_METTU|nr:GNAT family N-acetyltransferase [Methylocella tundrae]VTZ51832.1 GNAT family N-acetyltransferase [Methylocella tundrae]